MTFNLSTSNLSTLRFNRLVLFLLLISYLSASGFKLAKASFLANGDVSTPVAFLSQILLHN